MEHVKCRKLSCLCILADAQLLSFVHCDAGIVLLIISVSIRCKEFGFCPFFVWFLSLFVCLLFLNILLKATVCQVKEMYLNLSFAIIFLFLSFLCKLSLFHCTFVVFLFLLFCINLLFFSSLICTLPFSLFPSLRTFTLVAFRSLQGAC